MSDPEREDNVNENPMNDHRDFSICYSPDCSVIWISQTSSPHRIHSPEFEVSLWTFPDGNFIPYTQPHVRSPSPPSRERSPSPAPPVFLNIFFLQRRFFNQELQQLQEQQQQLQLQLNRDIQQQSQLELNRDIQQQSQLELNQDIQQALDRRNQLQQQLNQQQQKQQLQLQLNRDIQPALDEFNQLLQQLQLRLNRDIQQALDELNQLQQQLNQQQQQLRRALDKLNQHQQQLRRALDKLNKVQRALDKLNRRALDKLNQLRRRQGALQKVNLRYLQEELQEELHQKIRLQALKKLNLLKLVLRCLLNQNQKVREVKKLNLVKFEHKVLQQLEEFVLVQELDRLQNENRELHKFIQHASQITFQIEINMAHEIFEEGHDNSSIEILDKMTLVADILKFHLSWTKAPCRHRSLANGGDLKKSCTSFDGCHMHQDCMSTAKLEIYVEHHIERFQGALSSHIEHRLVHYARKIELQSFHAICEPIASGDDQPDSRCKLTHVSHSTKSPPGPNGLLDGEEMLQQDSLKHQLVGETHAMNDGENILSDGGIQSAFSYPENEGKLEELETHAMNDGEIVLSDGGIQSAFSYPENEGKLEELETHAMNDGENILTEGGIPCLVSCPENEGKLEELETHAMNAGENILTEGGIACVVSCPENEGNRKKSRKSKRKITLEDIKHFPGRLVDAAESFGVSKSTLKRICRKNGITEWKDRGIGENSQSLSKRKDIIEFVQGEGAEIGNQMAGGNRSCERELNHEQIGFLPESGKGSDRSQIGIGLMEESSTQMEITPAPDIFVSSPHEQCIEEGNPSKLPVQPSELNCSAACLRPDAINFTRIDHNISATVAFDIEQVPESSQTNLTCSDPVPKLAEATAAHMTALVTEMKDTRTVTMKATYGKDMIRFQLSLTSGIIELRKEVAERLTLKVGTFSIKYLDDDEDWILMTGDKDLQECFNISVSLGRKVIKLSIHEITPS